MIQTSLQRFEQGAFAQEGQRDRDVHDIDRVVSRAKSLYKLRGGAFAQASSKASSREMFMILNYPDSLSLSKQQLDKVYQAHATLSISCTSPCDL